MSSPLRLPSGDTDRRNPSGAGSRSSGSPGPSHPRAQAWGSWLPAALFTVSVVGIAAGGLAAAVGASGTAHDVWTGVTLAGVVPSTGWMVHDIRHGKVGVDLIALLALLGTLAVAEPLAGAVITVMLATGRLLEVRAGARAERDLRALVAREPHRALRHEARGLRDVALEDVALEDVALEDVAAGDLLLVSPGDVVGVDGYVETGEAVLDEAALTGEAMPVRRSGTDLVRSGVVNAGGAFDLRAARTAAESTHAGLVRLVAEAAADTSPFVRTADRAALVFLPLTLLTALGAAALTGDLVRGVAVLVVATPCPLLLAAPVAIVSGLSRASRRGVVVKGGAALEQLARATVLLVDKTGTLTGGRPRLVDVTCTAPGGEEELLRLAASLEQTSRHVLATAVVHAARGRDLALSTPAAVSESPGDGVCGTVEGRQVRVGSRAWVPGPELLAPGSAGVPAVGPAAELEVEVAVAEVHVAVDGVWAGVLRLADPVRADVVPMLSRLRRAGITRIVMLTGDREETSRAVGARLGLDEVHARCSPADKLAVVRAASAEAVTVMVGDGINDAPALAAAGVGVAMGAHGSAAASQAADVVLTVDRIDRLGDAMDIAHRSQRIAVQSVAVGMVLSLGAMAAAAVGLLPPLAGALLQEGVDTVVILNALRALTDGRGAHRQAQVPPSGPGPQPATVTGTLVPGSSRPAGRQ